MALAVDSSGSESESAIEQTSICEQVVASAIIGAAKEGSRDVDHPLHFLPFEQRSRPRGDSGKWLGRPSM